MCLAMWQVYIIFQLGVNKGYISKKLRNKMVLFLKLLNKKMEWNWEKKEKDKSRMSRSHYPKWATNANQSLKINLPLGSGGEKRAYISSNLWLETFLTNLHFFCAKSWENKFFRYFWNSKLLWELRRMVFTYWNAKFVRNLDLLKSSMCCSSYGVIFFIIFMNTIWIIFTK